MEILHCVKQMQNLLRLHDKAVEQIIILDNYMNSVSELAFNSAIQSNYIKVMRLMLRKSVAEGVKKMLKIYRLRKWFAVQSLIHKMTRSFNLRQGLALIENIEQITQFNQLPDIGQLSKEDVAARSWVVMECEFFRES